MYCSAIVEENKMCVILGRHYQ